MAMIVMIEHHIHRLVEEAIVEAIEGDPGATRHIEQKSPGIIRMADVVMEKVRFVRMVRPKVL